MSRDAWYIVCCIAAIFCWVIAIMVAIAWSMIKLADLTGSNLAYILLTGLVGSIAVTLGTIIKYGLDRSKSQKQENFPAGKYNEFTWLTIHYSKRGENPDTHNPSKRVISNNRTQQFYWISSAIDEPYVRAKRIQWHTHDSEKKMYAYFRKYGFTPNERDPELVELGLEQVSQPKPSKSIEQEQIRVTSPAKLAPDEVPNQIEVRHGGQIVRHGAYFYFISIHNLISKPIKGLMGEGVVVGRGAKPWQFIICPLKDVYAVLQTAYIDVVPDSSTEKGREEFAIALLNYDKWSKREVTLEEGLRELNCAMIFALEGADYFHVASYTRRWFGFPSKFTFELYLKGEGLPYHRAASFWIEAYDWKTFRVKQITG